MRLADEIIRDAEVAPEIFGLRTMAGGILGARRFDISSDAGFLINTLRASPMTKMEAMVSYARAPFESCWFEWEGPSASIGGFKATNDQEHREDNAPKPRRMGILIAAEQDNMGRGKAWWAWSHRLQDLDQEQQKESVRLGTLVQLGRLQATFDFSDDPVESFDIGRIVAKMKKISPEDIVKQQIAGKWGGNLIGMSPEGIQKMNSRWGMQPNFMLSEFMTKVFQLPDTTIGVRMMRAAFADVEGEPAYMEALLICLQAKNILHSSPLDIPEKLQNARVKSGKQKLVEFTRVDIDLSRGASGRAGVGQDRAALRAHFVRGHFKIRQTGIFWWSPYVRGDAVLGTVRQPEYRMTG